MSSSALASPFQLSKKKRTRPALVCFPLSSYFSCLSYSLLKRVATGSASAKSLGSPIAMSLSDAAEQRATEVGFSRALFLNYQIKTRLQMFTSHTLKRHRGSHQRHPIEDLPWVWRLDSGESPDGDLSALVDLPPPKRPRRTPYQRPLRDRNNHTLTFHELMPVYSPIPPPPDSPLRPTYDYLYTHGHVQ